MNKVKKAFMATLENNTYIRFPNGNCWKWQHSDPDLELTDRLLHDINKLGMDNLRNGMFIGFGSYALILTIADVINKIKKRR